MVEGRLASYSRGSGEDGAALYSTAVDRTVIGSSASKRLTLGIVTPYYGEELRATRVLVDVGLIVPRDVIIPFRIVMGIDGVTITREFKPQYLVGMEEGVYGKVIYDATALLASRIVARDLHRLSIVYTAARPVIFEDAGLAVVYSGVRGGWYSYNILGGALAMEPGDIVQLDVDLPESRSEIKNLVVKMHVPSRNASIRVEAGSSAFDAGGTLGPTVIEAPIRYRGSRARIYFYYNKPQESFYPKRAIISSIALLETITPTAKLEVESLSTEAQGDSVRITVEIVNSGGAPARDVKLLAFTQGTTTAKLDLGVIAPGDTVQAEVRLPRPGGGGGREVILRLIWKSYGRSGYVDRIVKV